MTTRHRTYDVLGILLKFHAFPEEVMGRYCLVECLVPPGAGAPPNHHAGETEAFFVLDGELDFEVAGDRRTVGAGAYVAIPDGAVHAFRAAGDRPARILILNVPGQMHDAFFTGVGRALPENQTTLPEPVTPDLPGVLAKATETGMTILAPEGA